MHFGPLCMQLRVPVRFFSLWESQKWGFSLRIAYFVPFYTINFFSDSPAGFALLLGQCAALRSLAQLTTPFLASGKAAILREKTPFLAFPEAKKANWHSQLHAQRSKMHSIPLDHPKKFLLCKSTKKARYVRSLGNKSHFGGIPRGQKRCC